jgi:hypothetical protein
MQTVEDDMQTDEQRTMVFIEFLECVCRIADAKDLTHFAEPPPEQDEDDEGVEMTTNEGFLPAISTPTTAARTTAVAEEMDLGARLVHAPCRVLRSESNAHTTVLISSAPYYSVLLRRRMSSSALLPGEGQPGSGMLAHRLVLVISLLQASPLERKVWAQKARSSAKLTQGQSTVSSPRPRPPALARATMALMMGGKLGGLHGGLSPPAPPPPAILEGDEEA